MAAASPAPTKERTYGSEYEKIVMTQTKHPPLRFRKDDNPYPPYQSHSFSFLRERWEELVVITFLTSVFFYVASFYYSIWTLMFPVRQVFAYAWDVVFAAVVVLRVIGKMLPRPPSKKKMADMSEADAKVADGKRKAAAKAAGLRRNVAMAVCAGVALARWHYGWRTAYALLTKA